MKKKLFLLIICLGCTEIEEAAVEVINSCTEVNSTFTINTDPTTCTVDIQAKLNTASVYEEVIEDNKRKITFNNIANHPDGAFPNSGNPNTISAKTHQVEAPLNPVIAASFTSAQGYDFGVFFSGVAIDPFTAEFFRNGGKVNRSWNETTLTTAVNLGLDCNNAHVQPTGESHYHARPTAFIEQLTSEQTPTEMVKLGYAADGFPIYYKYGYDTNGVLVEFESGYRLKEGSRPGDGVSAPEGCYDGLYFQDYEYVAGISALDQANGRMGKTPESEHKYYYVVTDNFPSSPLYFRGTPDPSFIHGGP